MANHRYKSESVDTRIISLTSRGLLGKVQEGDIRNGQYNMFAHYESLNVQSFPQKETDEPLLEAYKFSNMKSDFFELGVNSTFSQSLFAFTDIIGEQEKDMRPGYTRKEINHFWGADSKEPILFVSMLNIANQGSLEVILNKIQRIYPEGRHLAYMTFDYCDIIVFLRGHSFQECSNLIFSIDYGMSNTNNVDSRASLADSITLYAFTDAFQQAGEAKLLSQEEKFGAYFRFGMVDAQKAEEFYRKSYSIRKEDDKTKFHRNWILGRHDMGIFYAEADLNWLYEIDKYLREDEDSWYTNKTLSLMIKDDGNYQGRVSQSDSCPNLQKRLHTALDQFITVYKRGCERFGLEANEVWIRWISETTGQAISLFENNMTADLGLCLVPQFLDYFAYATSLWSSGENFQNDDRRKAEECFSTLFTNITNLIDSMNHSPRQYILTPAFRTVAFAMPPKIMAYYMTVIYFLKQAFQEDEDEAYYGFTMSPQFARELVVRSLAQKNITEYDQFISIGIGEKSLYRLRHTTAALSHEISHFIGNKARCRGIRKKHILLEELHNILIDLAEEVHQELVTYYTDLCENIGYKIPEDMPSKEIDHTIAWNNLEGEAAWLLETLGEDDWRYISSSEWCYHDQVYELLRKLPLQLYAIPRLREHIFQFLWRDLLTSEEGNTPLGEVAGILELQHNGLVNYSEDDDIFLNVTAKVNTYRIFINVLQRYRDKYDVGEFGVSPRPYRICKAFREAHADLQTIQLFEMVWEEYCELLADEKREIPLLEMPRFLAVATERFWQQESKKSDSTFHELWDKLALASQAQNDEINSQLKDLEIDPVLIYHLRCYLKEVSKAVSIHFECCPESVKLLRSMYRTISNQSSTFQVMSNLDRFIANYRQVLKESTD